MNPRVNAVSPLEGYRLKLEFANGEVKIFDCTPFLGFGVFQELQNKAYFDQIKVVDGTIAWPNEQDICPDTLYLDSV